MIRPILQGMAHKKSAKTANPAPAEVGVFEAKTTLSKLLARVAHGETILITRHGKAVAQLGPVATFDREKARAAIAAILAMKTNWTLEPGETIKDYINAGRP